MAARRMQFGLWPIASRMKQCDHRDSGLIPLQQGQHSAQFVSGVAILPPHSDALHAASSSGAAFTSASARAPSALLSQRSERLSQFSGRHPAHSSVFLPLNSPLPFDSLPVATPTPLSPSRRYT